MTVLLVTHLFDNLVIGCVDSVTLLFFLFSSNEYWDIVVRPCAFVTLTCVKMDDDGGKKNQPQKRPAEMERRTFALESFSCRSSS